MKVDYHIFAHNLCKYIYILYIMNNLYESFLLFEQKGLNLYNALQKLLKTDLIYVTGKWADFEREPKIYIKWVEKKDVVFNFINNMI